MRVTLFDRDGNVVRASDHQGFGNTLPEVVAHGSWLYRLRRAGTGFVHYEQVVGELYEHEKKLGIPTVW